MCQFSACSLCSCRCDNYAEVSVAKDSVLVFCSVVSVLCSSQVIEVTMLFQ